MPDSVSPVLTSDDKDLHSDASAEKKDIGADKELSDDARNADEVEEFEERLQRDEATEQEYLVREAYEVAIKVYTPSVRSVPL